LVPLPDTNMAIFLFIFLPFVGAKVRIN